MSKVDEFRPLYERHVGYVVAGDMKAAIADMVQENLPTVFEGVEVPRSAVDGFTIKDVRADGDRMIGDTVYEVGGKLIGLRSIWERRGDTWLAAELENFPTEAVQ